MIKLPKDTFHIVSIKLSKEDDNNMKWFNFNLIFTKKQFVYEITKYNS